MLRGTCVCGKEPPSRLMREPYVLWQLNKARRAMWLVVELP
jgi:hypothetical protein